MYRALVGSLCIGGAASASFGALVNIDFSTDDGGNALVNGQDISSPPEFGNLFNLSSSGPNAGLAIFDTNDPGPNSSGPDPDLLVNLGNALILQDSGTTTQTVAGIYDTPNDDANGGTIVFSFLGEVELRSIDLIDVNGNGPVFVTLIDALGREREYDAPMHWTHDIDVSGPDGYETLDLTTLANQPGEGGGIATATEDAGFNPFRVVSLEVFFTGSAALDNLTIETNPIPAPASAALLALGGVVMTRRRRG